MLKSLQKGPLEKSEYLFEYLRELSLELIMASAYCICMACCTVVRYTELVINNAQARPCVSEQYMVLAKDR